MGIKNLTEAEEKEFYRLVGKMNREETDKEHEQLAEWLEELKELREYKKKMKAQFLDDIENPLEPIKLSSALESEIFKYEYRAEHDPQKISPLDYTIIYALKHCLEEQLKEVE